MHSLIWIGLFAIISRDVPASQSLKRKKYVAILYDQQPNPYDLSGKWLLKVTKTKELIKINQHRPVEGSIRSATISARYNEEFYVALLCDVSPVKKNL